MGGRGIIKDVKVLKCQWFENDLSSCNNNDIILPLFKERNSYRYFPAGAEVNAPACHYCGPGSNFDVETCEMVYGHQVGLSPQ